jgi:hypothetical protein
MGMIATIEQVSPEQLSQFIRDPGSAYEYILEPLFENPDTKPVLEDMLREVQTSTAFPAWLKQEAETVFGQALAKAERHQELRLVKHRSAVQPRKRFRLEKDWHVLHYALNGTQYGGSGPMANAILGGTEIPDVDDVNRGLSTPIRYLRPEQVKTIAIALAAMDSSSILSKLDYEDAMAKQIYLAHTLDDLDSWSYLPSLFENFRDFYLAAAGDGNALLVSIV